MDTNLGYLFAAFFVTWLILALYVWNLSGRLSGLRRDLERLEQGEYENRESEPGS